MQQLGQWLSQFADNEFMLVLVITIVTMFLSEVMSNVAQVIVFAPVVSSLADAMGMNPLITWYSYDPGSQLRQYVAHGYSTKCHCVCQRPYQVKTNDKGGICDEYGGSSDYYFVLLVPASVVDEAMTLQAQLIARFFITLMVRYSLSFASYTSISVYFMVKFFLARLAGFLASSSDPSKN